jgi:putative glutamine amidotransferase
VPPLIGITTYHREREGRPRFTLPSAYVDAVRASGGMPVLLAPGEGSAHALAGRLDALVFSGGGDLDPSRFRGESHASVYFVCPERDAFEADLMKAALDRGLPILAICRGAQVLNTVLGGDLHPHLPDVVGARVAHRRSQEEATTHPVRLDPDSRLARVLGTSALPAVASWHHQAVRRLGAGLRAVAWADDGTVEALELEGAPDLLAVQWHPEMQVGEALLQERLFEALLQAAGNPRAGSPHR